MYLDTSVVVKLYAPEPDSEACERIVTGQRIVSSELLYTELWSALLAKERSGVLAPDDRQKIWQLFEIHLLEEIVELVEIDGEVVREAAEMIARVHPQVPLRTLDAIHLASFAGLEAGLLFTKDKRMRDAARLLEFPLADE